MTHLQITPGTFGCPERMGFMANSIIDDTTAIAKRLWEITGETTKAKVVKIDFIHCRDVGRVRSGPLSSAVYGERLALIQTSQTVSASSWPRRNRVARYFRCPNRPFRPYPTRRAAPRPGSPSQRCQWRVISLSLASSV